MGYRGMGSMGNGAQGYGPHRQWVTWAMGYRGMGHMGNEAHWGIGYRSMGYMGYGVQGVWATWAMGYMGNGVQGYEPHGEKVPMGNLLPKYQKDVKLSKRCQVVKKMSNVKK